jgi:hypothetical protein
MLIEDLKIDTIVAGFNGGVFVKPDPTLISSRLISRAAGMRGAGLDQRKPARGVALYR